MKKDKEIYSAFSPAFLSLQFVKSPTCLNSSLIRQTNFNDDVGCWDTSLCTTMEGMFEGAAAFNQSLAFDTSSFFFVNVTSCTTMQGMFYGAAAFNQHLDWDLSNCNVEGMFSHCV